MNSISFYCLCITRNRFYVADRSVSRSKKKMAAEEWRQCVDWLVQCQILPSDHKATKKDGTAFDLAQALRDGVLICHLMNQLCPGSVDTKDFSPRPQMSQVCFCMISSGIFSSWSLVSCLFCAHPASHQVLLIVDHYGRIHANIFN